MSTTELERRKKIFSLSRRSVKDGFAYGALSRGARWRWCDGAMEWGESLGNGLNSREYHLVKALMTSLFFKSNQRSGENEIRRPEIIDVRR